MGPSLAQILCNRSDHQSQSNRTLPENNADNNNGATGRFLFSCREGGGRHATDEQLAVLVRLNLVPNPHPLWLSLSPSVCA